MTRDDTGRWLIVYRHQLSAVAVHRRSTTPAASSKTLECPPQGVERGWRILYIAINFIDMEEESFVNQKKPGYIADKDGGERRPTV